VRAPQGQWCPRPILYLGEINDSQKAAWTKDHRSLRFQIAKPSLSSPCFPLQRAYSCARDRSGAGAFGRIQFASSAPVGRLLGGLLLWQQLQLDAFGVNGCTPAAKAADWKSILQCW